MCQLRSTYDNLLRFNRYMVECESTLILTSFPAHIVLIDTWWNVNYYAYLFLPNVAHVLIDTWWNVNTDKIVFSTQFVYVLIDTWWNVNLFLMTA